MAAPERGSALAQWELAQWEAVLSSFPGVPLSLYEAVGRDLDAAGLEGVAGV